MTTPSREEIDAIWAELRALEKRMEQVEQQVSSDVLTIARELARANALSFRTSLGHLAAGMGKLKAYSRYIGPKLKSLDHHIGDAQSISEVFSLHMAFLENCLAYMESLTE